MRRIALTVALVGTLAMPALAASGPVAAVQDSQGLAVQLASTSPPAPWFTSGVIAGRLGGVPVVGSYAGTSRIGIITLTAHGATFAYGGYACLRKACTFTGLLAGVHVLRFPIPLNIRGAGRAVASAFPSRVSWIAAVAEWSRQHLRGHQRDQVVAEAAATGS